MQRCGGRRTHTPLKALTDDADLLAFFALLDAIPDPANAALQNGKDVEEVHPDGHDDHGGDGDQNEDQFGENDNDNEADQDEGGDDQDGTDDDQDDQDEGGDDQDGVDDQAGGDDEQHDGGDDEQDGGGGGGGHGCRQGGHKRRGTLEPPSFMWGPFRMTHRKPNEPGKMPSWQITCPFHDTTQKTKCTRSLTMKSMRPEDIELGHLRLFFWGVQGMLCDSKKAHQAKLRKACEWPRSFKKMSAEHAKMLRDKLERKKQRCEEQLACDGSVGNSSSSSSSSSSTSSSVDSSDSNSSSDDDEEDDSDDDHDEVLEEVPPLPSAEEPRPKRARCER